jgi:hypothetical protein
MLDIRTLLLGSPEDRYASSIALRDAERLLFPLLSWRRQDGAIPATARAPCPAEAMR